MRDHKGLVHCRWASRASELVDEDRLAIWYLAIVTSRFLQTDYRRRSSLGPRIALETHRQTLSARQALASTSSIYVPDYHPTRETAKGTLFRA